MYSNCTISDVTVGHVLHQDNSVTLSSSNAWVLTSDPLSAVVKADYMQAESTTNCINKSVEKECMPPNAKTLLYNRKNVNGLYIKIADNDGFVWRDHYLMADVDEVSIIENNGDKRVVVVTFTDGLKEKAVLEGNDVFTLEQGISVCIAKKLLSDKIGSKHGSSVYNKLTDRGVKVYNKTINERAKKSAEEAAKKEKYKKLIAKKQAKRQKREAAERENQIEIQKEAYLRAMREFNTRSAD